MMHHAANVSDLTTTGECVSLMNGSEWFYCNQWSEVILKALLDLYGKDSKGVAKIRVGFIRFSNDRFYYRPMYWCELTINKDLTVVRGNPQMDKGECQGCGGDHVCPMTRVAKYEEDMKYPIARFIGDLTRMKEGFGF